MTYFINIFIMLKYDFLVVLGPFGVLSTFGLHISKHITAGKESVQHSEVTNNSPLQGTLHSSFNQASSQFPLKHSCEW